MNYFTCRVNFNTDKNAKTTFPILVCCVKNQNCFLKNDQKVFEFYDDIPDQFYSLIELAFCAFLSDEGKDEIKYLEHIKERTSEV